MHKKLEADLISLAHSLLQMKNKEDVFALKEKAYEIYEKLSVLSFVEEYVNTTPNATKTTEELSKQVEEGFENKQKPKVINEQTEVVKDQVKDKPIDETVEQHEEIFEEEDIEQPFNKFEKLLFPEDENVKNDVKDIGEKKVLTLEEELKNTIPVDVVANLFENAVPKSLNDKLQANIQIGLNDRIAFVKNLFNGSQEEFNRVLSQLNTFKTEKEAKKFIHKMVKPDYNWSKNEELETRFIEIIERRFA